MPLNVPGQRCAGTG